MVSTDEWKDPSLDWQEAERFDKWIRDNAGALRAHVFAEKESKPYLRDKKGVLLATRLYYVTNGAPVRISAA